MNEEVVLLQSDLKNTETELRGIVRIQKRLYWFLAPGVLLAPLGLLWHWILCFVIFGLFGVLFATASYISYGHQKGLGRRRDHLVERLTDLGHPPEFS